MNDSTPPIPLQLRATVERVLGRASRRLAQEIAGFWLLHGAIANPAEVRRRIGEVLLVLRGPDQAIVAVTSIYPYPMNPPGHYLGFRAFIDPAWRGMSMMIQTLDSSVAALHQNAIEPTAVMFVSDNRKLMGKGVRRWYERKGWRRISPDDAEKDEWLMMVGPRRE